MRVVEEDCGYGGKQETIAVSAVKYVFMFTPAGLVVDTATHFLSVTPLVAVTHGEAVMCSLANRRKWPEVTGVKDESFGEFWAASW